MKVSSQHTPTMVRGRGYGLFHGLLMLVTVPLLLFGPWVVSLGLLWILFPHWFRTAETGVVLVASLPVMGITFGILWKVVGALDKKFPEPYAEWYRRRRF